MIDAKAERDEGKTAPIVDAPGGSMDEASDPVDEQSCESFPASDAPSFTPITGTGAPAPADEGPPATDE